MNLNEYIKTKEEQNFDVVENKDETGNFTGYTVTYKFANKSLTETILYEGQSKKSMAKKLETVKNKLQSKLKYVVESSATVSSPGGDLIRNDYVEKVFQKGFTSDTTTLSPKEIADQVIHMTTVEPRLLDLYIKQAEDNAEYFEKVGQKNRVADLKIRLAMAKLALASADYLGKFSE